MKLFELIDEMKQLVDMSDEGVKADWLQDTLDGLKGEIDVKCENIALAVKTLTAEAQAIKAEEDALAKRRKNKEAVVDRLKTYLTEAMTAAGIPKLETARCKLSFRTSSSIEIDNEDQFVRWAVRDADDLLVFPPPKVSKTAIADALREGRAIPGAQLVEKKNLQIK